ncbi:MAG TPA: winged helix-turn-helix domain-containing protein, partial [Vicinamibacteria bacterium]|nr:winged helix-turn-helix domain-containing protein [Vicinamibacteria bacterium]
MPEPRPYEFGPFRLDTEKSVLWRADQLVPLTPKALALLQVLLEHGGDVVSKATLMARVWPDAAVEEANLSVTVAALRKALGPQPEGRPYVQTIPKRGYRFDAPLHVAGPGPELGLAVLPFVCLGPETEEHLGIGLADALIGRLTEVEGLRVRPTGAVSHYLKHPKAPREAAKELGVDAVVGGTVQRDGGRIRVSVQLVPLPAALRPWADSFDADWTDLFGVQDVMAERVAQALSLRLTSNRPAVVRHTPHPEAYEAHLRARFLFSRLDPPSLGKAFGYYGEAVRLDPRYAPPHAGLADCYLLLGLAGLLAPREAWNLTEECAERALALDPACAEALVSRAYARLFRDWDWAGARVALEQATTLAPRQASGHLWRGLFLTLTSDLAEARRAIHRGREIDPLSGLGSALRCLFYELVEDYEEEVVLSRRAIELRPDNFLGYWSLGLANALLGKVRPARKALLRALELTEQGLVMRAQMAWALARLGEAEEARQMLVALDGLAESAFVSPCQRGSVLAALGDIDGGLA